MTLIFSTLAGQCVRLSRITDEEVYVICRPNFPVRHNNSLNIYHMRTIRDPANVPWLLTDQVEGWEGSSIQRAWQLLRTELEKHDSLENNWAYHKAVFTRILDQDRFSRVPTWLVKFFEAEQPEFLVRTSLKYGLVEQAIRYCLAMVRKVIPHALHNPPVRAHNVLTQTDRNAFSSSRLVNLC